MSACRRLLVCEGYEDKHFFRALIKARNLPEFRVIDTSSKVDKSGGISKFKRAINAFKAQDTRPFLALSDILVVADNDTNPTQNFIQVQTQIEAVFPGRSPDRPRHASNSTPPVTILMLPWDDERGSLETVCMGGARKATQIGLKVDAFITDVGGEHWGEPRRGKAWLRTSLAVRHEDPFITLGHVFKYRGHLIRLDDHCFDGIAGILESLR
jgi:hypothetical protein